MNSILLALCVAVGLQWFIILGLYVRQFAMAETIDLLCQRMNLKPVNDGRLPG